MTVNETQPEMPSSVKPNLKNPRSNFGRWIWLGWIVFAVFLVILVSQSLQPRMPGMPASGGYMPAPKNSDGSSQPANMPNMPGMDKP